MGESGSANPRPSSAPLFSNSIHLPHFPFLQHHQPSLPRKRHWADAFGGADLFLSGPGLPASRLALNSLHRVRRAAKHCTADTLILSRVALA